MSLLLTQIIGDNIIQIGTDRIAVGSVDYQVGPGGHITIFNISDRRERVKPHLATEFVDDNDDPLFADLDAFETWFAANFFFSVGVTTIDPEVMEFKGMWNAATNTPALADGDGVIATGNVYLVSVAGTHNFGSGALVFAEGDTVIYDGTIWHKGGNIGAIPDLNTVMTAGNTSTKQLSISAAAATFAADFQGSNTSFRLAILTGATGAGLQGYNNGLSAARFIFLQASGGNIGIGTTTDDATAILNIVSTTKGVLVPRMTTVQKLAIGSPGTATIGMVVFDTDLGRLCEFTAVGWVTIITSADIPTTGNTYITGTASTLGSSANVCSVTPGNNKVFTYKATYQGKVAGSNRVYSGTIICAGKTSGLGNVSIVGQGVVSAPITDFTGAGNSVVFAVTASAVVITVTSDVANGAATWQVNGEYFIN